MKSKIIIIFVAVAIVFIGLQALRINSLTEERDRYRSNTSALLHAVEVWRTKDSLSVARSEVLTLRLSEMERYRAEDMKTIEALKVDKRDLETVTTLQANTIAELRGTVTDTMIVYRDRIVADSAQVLHVSDEWIDLHGVVYDGGFDGTLEVRDSLTIVEAVERHRFLGFLWRTKKVKSHNVTVTSKNPYTEIVGVESITIEK